MGSNAYLDEVLEQQANVAQELRKQARPAALVARGRSERVPSAQGGAMPPRSAIDVRITGWWRWKTVIVPPNVWVVHTRRGHTEPLHLGLGVSFPYDPYRDGFLVAPATMQTLAINAKCICSERQGILVQAYVQWIVDDFKAAYQKLDFSDLDDPMRIVNIQLREQAEASIKDKVATLSIDEVLADKRPIIDELTSRLRSVAEGQGLKIIQVQIKEAVISSTSVWEDLQRPFREEKSRLARMAQLDREAAIYQREVGDRILVERQEILASAETERVRRMQEVELATSRAELEDARVSAELAEIAAQRRVDSARAEAALAAVTDELLRLEKVHSATITRDRASLAVEAERRVAENDVGPNRIDELLVRALPEIIQNLPRAEHMVSIGAGLDGVGTLQSTLKSLRTMLGEK